MALDAGLFRVYRLVVIRQCSRATEEGRKTVREGTLRASKADGICPHAPICLVVPLPLGTIGMSVRPFAAQTLEAPIVYAKVERPVAVLPRALIVDRRGSEKCLRPPIRIQCRAHPAKQLGDGPNHPVRVSRASGNVDRRFSGDRFNALGLRGVRLARWDSAKACTGADTQNSPGVGGEAGCRLQRRNLLAVFRPQDTGIAIEGCGNPPSTARM